jgi:hypothetical protein
MIKSALQSSLTNDVKYRNLGAANTPSNEYLIETVDVTTSSISTVQFTNLSQYTGVYRHLIMRFVVRDARATSGGNYLFITFNGSSSGYYTHRLLGIGSSFSVSSEVGQSVLRNLVSTSAQDGSGIFSSGTMEIIDAFHTSKNKVARAHFGYNAGDTRTYLTSGMWESTAALNSITITSDTSAVFAVGTSFSIYGVTA